MTKPLRNGPGNAAPSQTVNITKFETSVGYPNGLAKPINMDLIKKIIHLKMC